MFGDGCKGPKGRQGKRVGAMEGQKAGWRDNYGEGEAKSFRGWGAGEERILSEF